MKTYSKEEIISLKDDLVKFKNEIIESKGFLLYMADKYGINLSPSLLVETISPYSIRFISEHMKNNKYTKEQSEIVIGYLKEDDDEDVGRKVKSYNLKDLLFDIKEGKELPVNMAQFYQLSFADFLNNQKIISSLLEYGDDGWIRSNKFTNNHPLLMPLFENINKEDFLKIDLNTLGNYPGIFSMARHLMLDPDIKKIFNKAVNIFYNKDEIKKDGYKPKLESYVCYPFDKNEKELFLKLLQNEYSRDYGKIKRYSGFSDFFTKKEYILNYNISGIKYFTKNEIVENLEEIRSGIIAAYFRGSYKNYEKIYFLDIDKDSFVDVFNKEYIENIIINNGGFDFVDIDRDLVDKNLLLRHIHKIVYGLCLENEKILDLVGFKNILEEFYSLIEYNRRFYDEESKEARLRILDKFDKAIESKNLFKNFDKNNCSCYYENNTPKIIIEAMNGKENINYLFALLFITNGIEGKWEVREYINEIERIIPLLNKDDVLSVASIFDFKVDSKLLRENVKQNYEFNFLNFSSEIIKNMDFNTFMGIFKISEKFRNMILDENFDNIIIDEKNKNKDSYKKDLMGYVLDSVDGVNSNLFGFLKRFTEKNHNFMLEHYFNTMVSHKVRDDFIKIDMEKIELDSYKKIEEKLEDYFFLLRKHELLVADNDNKKNQKKETKNEVDKLYNEKEKIKKEIDEFVSNIGFNFYFKKIKDSDTIKSIRLYEVNKCSDFKDLVFDKIESLSFEETKDLLGDKDFLKFLYNNKKDASSYSSKVERAIYLNKSFTKKQNIELVEIMLKNFNNKKLFNYEYEKEILLSKVLSLITKENSYEITNDLAVKHDYKNLFSSYDYLPNNTMLRKYVKKPFSVKQIRQAIDNLSADGRKIISITEVNYSHDTLLASNYENNRSEKERDKKLKEYLELIRGLEGDPINYLACIHSDIVANFIKEGEFEYVDIAKSSFYEKHINIDVVLEAMSEIFSLASRYHNDTEFKMKNFDKQIYGGIAIEKALGAVLNFIAFTYHSSGEKVTSEFSEDKSRRIFKKIMDEAPYLMFDIYNIGKMGSINDEISRNFANYYTTCLVDNLFLRSGISEITKGDLVFSYHDMKNDWKSQKADIFLKNLIKYLSDTKNDDLYKLDFIIKESEFNKSRPYTKRVRDFSTPFTDFMSNDEGKKIIQKSLLFMELNHISTNENKKISKNKI